MLMLPHSDKRLAHTDKVCKAKMLEKSNVVDITLATGGGQFRTALGGQMGCI
jgi:hypothetical protein